MIVLVFNPGSASLKFDLLDVSPSQRSPDDARIVVRGTVEHIGKEPTLTRLEGKAPAGVEPVAAADYEEATRSVLAWVERLPQQGGGRIDLLAFRVVHGGGRFDGPARIDDDVLGAIEELSDLAPLHNKPALAVIRAASEAHAGSLKIAVFDTSFHRSLPEHAFRYAIPPDLADRYGIRRYGFHGASHAYMAQRYASLVEKPLSQIRIVTLHLESGCSACAIDRGRSVDTSMGFTPLEGLAMGTRSGDIDPSVVGFLCRKEGYGPDGAEEVLNKQGGLLGLSGFSLDTRDLMKAYGENPRARLAMDVFAYRVRKYVGSYLAAMNGADAVVFGGGIGEDTPFVRERVCEGLAFAGLTLDRARNDATINTTARISTDDSALHAWVIPTDEALELAHEAALLVAGQRASARPE